MTSLPNDREELAGTVASHFRVHGNGLAYIEHNAAADAILAAGYRKPRTVSTVEELEALPIGSVVLDRDGMALQNTQFDLSGTGWNAANGTRDIEREVLEADAFPATVVYEAEAGK